MDKKTKNRVKGIAIFIVFLAIATSIIEFRNKEGRTASFNYKPSQQEYRDLKFINKAQVSFTAQDVRRSQSAIGDIIDKYSVKQIRKQNDASFGAYIFSIPRGDLKLVLEDLGKFGVVGSHIEQIDTSLVNIDYETESARLASYEKEQNDLYNLRFPTDTQNRRKEALHSLIHQSRLNLDKLKESQNVLLYITLSPLQKNSNAFIAVKNMTISFFSWLGIYAVGMVIVYFGTRLLMYFLGAIGIKGLNASGLGGSYQYGGYTGKYSESYAYNAGKRKVKRVYKDKRSTETPNDQDKTT